MKKKTLPLYDVFVSVPEGFWVEDWAKEYLSSLDEADGKKIIHTVISYRKEMARLESWGIFYTREILMPVRGIAQLTHMSPLQVLNILHDQTQKGIWLCQDCRQLEPLVSFIYTPKKLGQDSLEGEEQPNP